MTCIQSKRAKALMVAAVVAASWTSAASADCLRRIYNRSTAALVASQDGGPAFVVPPGRSAAVRLSRPGQIDLTAYCTPVDRLGRPLAGGQEAARIRLTYEAVLDRCFMTFGDNFFQQQLGPGFAGTTDTAPFTVNNPNQGDIVLGPTSAVCSVPN